MQLWIGLGNPGPKYALHRHNVGFMAADAIAEAWSFDPPKRGFQSHLRLGRIGGERVLLAKPQTFMNEAGQAVGEAMRFHKLAPADVTVTVISSVMNSEGICAGIFLVERSRSAQNATETSANSEN